MCLIQVIQSSMSWIAPNQGQHPSINPIIKHIQHKHIYHMLRDTYITLRDTYITLHYDSLLYYISLYVLC